MLNHDTDPEPLPDIAFCEEGDYINYDMSPQKLKEWNQWQKRHKN